VSLEKVKLNVTSKKVLSENEAIAPPSFAEFNSKVEDWIYKDWLPIKIAPPFSA